MSDVTTQAFAHPEARSTVTAPERDRISVRDHTVTVEIGAFQAERGVTQRIRFNVVVEVAPMPSDLGDDVDRILSYDRITEAIEGELTEERLNLLETLAERVAERILLEPQATRVFVRIEKLDRGPGTLGVEIVRERAGDPAPSAELDTPHPVVVALGNAEISSDALGALLDQLAGRPVILTVGPSDIKAPQSKAALAQRRVDLLAIEQNAWVLAGRDKRCVVVDTRTELDWGLRNGQLSVWAPSKMVLDAVDGAPSDPGDAGALVAWFAVEMLASAIWSIGLEIPTCAVPITQHSLGYRLP